MNNKYVMEKLAGYKIDFKKLRDMVAARASRVSNGGKDVEKMHESLRASKRQLYRMFDASDKKTENLIQNLINSRTQTEGKDALYNKYIESTSNTEKLYMAARDPNFEKSVISKIKNEY